MPALACAQNGVFDDRTCPSIMATLRTSSAQAPVPQRDSPAPPAGTDAGPSAEQGRGAARALPTGGPPLARRPLPGGAAGPPPLQRRRLSITPGAPATERPADDIDLHAVWYSQSALQPSSSRDPAFRKQLASTYLRLADAMHGAPANVQAHLWTDRASAFALHLPVVNPDGSEIEIPHSMLQKGRVTVHAERDLHAMIEAIPDPALRDTVQKLHDHPARENVGFRADVLRQIVTLLHQRDDTRGRALNVYADRDTLADVACVRDWSALGNEGTPPPVEGQDRAKLSIRAMANSLAVPQRAPGVIPQAIQSEGFATHGYENDTLAAVPGAARPGSIAREMLNTVQAVGYSGPISNEFSAAQQRMPQELQRGIRQGVALFASLARGNPVPAPQEIDPQQALTTFLLAERIRGIEPQLQQHVDGLQATARTTTDAATRQRCIGEISSLTRVYEKYSGFTEHFVNLCSYFPQVAQSSRAAAYGLNDAYNDIFGAIPRMFASEGSWTGSLTHSLAAAGNYRPTFQEQAHANRLILDQLTQQPARET
jgi:hypothetical protein